MDSTCQPCVSSDTYGIDNAGVPLGIDNDLLFLKAEKRNIDNWELSFRDFVADRFYEGHAVNDYVRLLALNIDGKSIVRAEVSARSKLSFLLERKSQGPLRSLQASGKSNC